MDTDQPKIENQEPEALTRIRPAYTLYATPECSGEMEQIMVKDFLNTLAEVALAVASRKVADKGMNQ